MLTDSSDPKQYLKKMRTRDPELNVWWGTICTPTKMQASDGKFYSIQAATAEGIFFSLDSNPPISECRTFQAVDGIGCSTTSWSDG